MGGTRESERGRLEVIIRRVRRERGSFYSDHPGVQNAEEGKGSVIERGFAQRTKIDHTQKYVVVR